MRRRRETLRHELFPNISLRKRITVYYSMAEPQDPNKHLQENELCCSYVFDPDGVTADGHSTGMLHSLADTV